ncbi:MAG: mechanosensitive ion channel family protein [Hydrogenophaga sp.]|uniref:mechanosensitive ion channel family protein n=1 Tax=Hydrogenophaga sp. TaxID=1904254 RepID=UPI0026281DF4|nr:mechanosensitive ion channel family protein [Hydrogenophaga sp.]MCV0440912.1 mechanosensitive ion channel family protein [Hydrogenophaga sp.]
MNVLAEFLNRFLETELWLATALSLVLLTLLASQIVRMLFKHATRLAQRSATHWDEALVNAARLPVQAVIWLVSLGWMARLLQPHWTDDADLLTAVRQLHDVGIVLCVAWFLWKFVVQVTQTAESRSHARGEAFDATTFDALSKLARLLVFVAAVITIAQTLGFKIGGLLALGGVGGLAVGLAAKDLLANFFGGLTIYLDRPFSVGDWIRSPDKSIEGTVEYISWRHTRIRAFNKNPIYVPNAVFTSIVVENPSRMSHRRLKETLGLRYDDFDQVDRVVADIKAMLLGHEGIDTRETLIVNFNAFGASSLDIMIYGFTKTRAWVEYHAVKQDVLLRIGRIVAAHGAQVAFPTQTLHMASAPETTQRDGLPAQT